MILRDDWTFECFIHQAEYKGSQALKQADRQCAAQTVQNVFHFCYFPSDMHRWVAFNNRAAEVEKCKL